MEAQKNLPQSPKDLLVHAKRQRYLAIAQQFAKKFFRPHGRWSVSALTLSGIILISGLTIIGAFFSDMFAKPGSATAGCIQITPTAMIDSQPGSLANSSLNSAATCVPPQYTWVRYVTFSGAQYINTGINQLGDTTITADFNFSTVNASSATQYLFGGQNSPAVTSTYERMSFGSISSQWIAYYGNLSGTGGSADTLRHTVVMHNGVTTVGSTLIYNPAQQTFTSGQNIYLGVSNNGGSPTAGFFNGNVYSFSIAKSGTTVINLIPVVNNQTGTCGFYDTISKSFFANQGSGTLTCPQPVANPACDNLLCNGMYQGDTGVAIAPNTVHDYSYTLQNTGTVNWQNYIGDAVGGWLNAPYTPVDYVQFNDTSNAGLAYIDTGEDATGDVRVVLDTQVDISTNTRAIFGVVNSVNNNTIINNSLYYYRNTSASMLAWWAGVNTTVALDANRHVITQDNGNTYVDGVLMAQQTGTATSTLSMYLGNANAGGSGSTNDGATVNGMSGKFYSVQIYKSGTLVRDFVPVINNMNGQCGFYDTVSQSFFANQGTGTLTCATPDSSVNTPRLVIYPATASSTTITNEIANAKTAAANGSVPTFPTATCAVAYGETTDMNFIDDTTDTGCQLSAVHLNDAYSVNQSKTYDGAKFVLFVPDSLAPNADVLANTTVNFGTASGARNVVANGPTLGNWKQQVRPWVSADIDTSAVLYGRSTTVANFAYNGTDGTDGSAQTYTVPINGEWLLETWGAQGGDSVNGGKGGYSSGTMNLNYNQPLSIYVGGQGSTGSPAAGTAMVGGWNGGGAGYSNSGSLPLGGGGGATDIRSSGTALTDRIIVAGGGGGSGSFSTSYFYAGGVGGGNSGGNGANGGTGGTQTSGGVSSSYNVGNCIAGVSGSLGAGGAGCVNGGFANGGGGGGYYGGAGGGYINNTTTSPGAGGGGSGYIGGVSSFASFMAQTIAGNLSMPAPGGGTETGQTGNGFARMTLLVITAWAH